MKPFGRVETIGRQVLLLADSRDAIGAMPSVDLVLTDPPYGIGFSYSGGGKSRTCRGAARGRNAGRPIVGDNAAFDPRPFLIAPAILFGADHYMQRLPPGGMLHVWDKDPKGRLSWDSYSDAELFWTSWTRSRTVFRYLWKGLCQEGAGEVRHHPMAKPVALMEWCIGLRKGVDIVLDPFMGSGTTLIACQRLGKVGVGVEIDPNFFEAACIRVDEAARQPALFEIEHSAEEPLTLGL